MNLPLTPPVRIPLLKDGSKSHAAFKPSARLIGRPAARTLIVNPYRTAFDNPELRVNRGWASNRKPSIDLFSEGEADRRGHCCRPPEECWWMPAPRSPNPYRLRH